MIEEIQRRVNADQALQHRGRWVNLTFVFGIGEIFYPTNEKKAHKNNNGNMLALSLF